jgi:hypothetical protein
MQTTWNAFAPEPIAMEEKPPFVMLISIQTADTISQAAELGFFKTPFAIIRELTSSTLKASTERTNSDQSNVNSF